MKKLSFRIAVLLTATLALSAGAAAASRVKFSGHIETGLTVNTSNPSDRQNFGRLFDDRSNEPLLNQILLTAERPLDSGATGFDWGFKLQGMYGSDARFIHSLGLQDHATDRQLQPDLVEAYLNLHFTAAATAGGVDVKVGKFVTLEGAEVIDNTGNLFYSHTYLFNFGIPFNHTGVLATIHATKGLDVNLGLVRGVNTSIDDNNDALAFHGGFGLPGLADGKLTVLVSTHIGPETPRDDKRRRYLNDIVAIYKASDTLTLTTDLNYIYDDLAKAKGYGVAQYFSWVVSPTATFNLRAELWRDQDGFYVAQFGNNTDLLGFLRGDSFTADPRTVGGGSTTYGALTIGVTYKFADTLTFRPELRYDKSLNGTTPFNDSRRGSQLTFAIDATYSF
jgi:hypothetical protein